MTQPKLTLNLNEQNELAFKLSIEGSSEDVDSSKPNIRFLVRESGRDTGWIYPAKKGEDGFVAVNINDSDLFSEQKTYTGKLEVILGNHYFVPAEVDMEFIQPLKVEAAVVTKNRSKMNESTVDSEEKPVAVTANTVQVRSKNSIKEVPRRAKTRNSSPGKPTRRKRKWAELTKEEQKRVKQKLLQQRKTELRKAKLDEQKKKTQSQKKEQAVKDVLKTLMSDSLLAD